MDPIRKEGKGVFEDGVIVVRRLRECCCVEGIGGE